MWEPLCTGSGVCVVQLAFGLRGGGLERLEFPVCWGIQASYSPWYIGVRLSRRLCGSYFRVGRLVCPGDLSFRPACIHEPPVEVAWCRGHQVDVPRSYGSAAHPGGMTEYSPAPLSFPAGYRRVQVTVVGVRKTTPAFPDIHCRP